MSGMPVETGPDDTEGTASPAPSDIAGRLDGLADAAEAATGRLDDTLVEKATGIVERARGRLKLSSDHTVVGIAGATGSGKSSTFNALTDLELSAVGVRRPTTSWATACVWGSEGAAELLQWLGIPDRHQTTRDSMLDTRRENHELDGVVLLDLPDHDSTEVSHHLEVDRLVALADMLVWVLDPQKYADAAIHDRYLEPLQEHDEVMVVVLNHIDSVPEERREAMVADVRRLLDLDGLTRVPVIPVSARLGWGIPELKAEIARRVSEKKATKGRLEADIAQTADQMAKISGEPERAELPPARVEVFDDGLAQAAGVPAAVEAVRASTARRTQEATAWPPLAWLAARRGTSPATPEGEPEIGPIERRRVDAEVIELAEQSAEGLGAPWRTSVRQVSVGRRNELADRLGDAVRGVDLGASRLPGWVPAVRIVQWVLLALAVIGLIWTVVAAIAGASLLIPLALLVGGLVLGIVLALVCRGVIAGMARRRSQALDTRLREAISSVSEETVIAPVRAELAAYTSMREGLARARA